MVAGARARRGAAAAEAPKRARAGFLQERRAQVAARARSLSLSPSLLWALLSYFTLFLANRSIYFPGLTDLRYLRMLRTKNTLERRRGSACYVGHAAASGARPKTLLEGAREVFVARLAAAAF